MKKNLRFSIITATKNPVDILPTLKSLKKQNFRSYENIIVDSSKDNSVKKKYSKNFNFKYFYNKKLSLYEALNLGIKKSSGDVIFFLHSDDILADQNVLKNISKIFLKKKFDIIYANIKIIKHNKLIRIWEPGNFNKEKFLKGWHPPHTSLFIKKKIYIKNGLFNLKYKIASDYDLMLRLLYFCNYKIYYLNKFILKMNFGGESTKSYKNIYLSNFEVYKILKNYNFSFPIILILKKLLSKLMQLKII